MQQFIWKVRHTVYHDSIILELFYMKIGDLFSEDLQELIVMHWG